MSVASPINQIQCFLLLRRELGASRKLHHTRRHISQLTFLSESLLPVTELEERAPAVETSGRCMLRDNRRGHHM